MPCLALKWSVDYDENANYNYGWRTLTLWWAGMCDGHADAVGRSSGVNGGFRPPSLPQCQSQQSSSSSSWSGQDDGRLAALARCGALAAAGNGCSPAVPRAAAVPPARTAPGRPTAPPPPPPPSLPANGISAGRAECVCGSMSVSERQVPARPSVRRACVCLWRVWTDCQAWQAPPPPRALCHALVALPLMCPRSVVVMRGAAASFLPERATGVSLQPSLPLVPRHSLIHCRALVRPC